MSTQEKISEYLTQDGSAYWLLDDYHVCPNFIEEAGDGYIYRIDFNHKELNWQNVKGYGVSNFYKIYYDLCGNIILMKLYAQINRGPLYSSFNADRHPAHKHPS
jgi:hypothetical protein